MQLSTIHILDAQLELVTGLHIGAGDGEIHIGGIDSSVIKHPYTQEPYIPGSSIKGKMRALLEWRAGLVQVDNGQPVNARMLSQLSGEKLDSARQIARLFGLSGDSNNPQLAEQIGPSRLSFWDCNFNKSWLETLAVTDALTEAKSENRIDRITGVAEHPRQIERVPAGAQFDFRLTWKELQGDSDGLNWILAGLKLLELDGIGGSGSRGYGKIRFLNLQLNGDDIQDQLTRAQPFAIGG